MVIKKLRDVDYVSLDFACTTFWEPGCDPKYSFRYARDTLLKILDMLREKGYSIRELDDPYKFYREILDSTYRTIPGEPWIRYVLLKMLSKLGVDTDEYIIDEISDFYVKERSRHFIPQPGLEMLLKTIIARGYRIVLTTAITSHDIVKNVLEHSGLMKYFKLIFSTQMVGLKKSDPKFYSQLVETLCVEPYMVIHVGDDLVTDIEPARINGLKTIYYGWRTKCRASDPQPCILELREVLNYLPP